MPGDLGALGFHAVTQTEEGVCGSQIVRTQRQGSESECRVQDSQPTFNRCHFKYPNHSDELVLRGWVGALALGSDTRWAKGGRAGRRGAAARVNIHDHL